MESNVSGIIPVVARALMKTPEASFQMVSGTFPRPLFDIVLCELEPS